MSKHGNGVRCGGCGRTFPVTRESLKSGFRCKKCRGGSNKKRRRQRPSW